MTDELPRNVFFAGALGWLPWRLRRLLTAIRINHVRAIITFLRFLLMPPKLNIIFTGQFFGGIGGTEKKLKCLVESMPDSRFHIQAGRVQKGGFVPKSYNWYLNLPVPRNRQYDAVIAFCGGGIPDNLFEDRKSYARFVDTNASAIFGIEDKFDYILVQTEDMKRFTDRVDKFLVAFPDPRPGFPARTTPVSGLPDKYFLTVFNPFSQLQKRQDLLLKLAPQAAYPIVWCLNDTTGWDFSHVKEADNIVILRNLTQKELYFVYKNAVAFVSFSLWESFGWTLAEAYLQNLPIIATETGILSYVKDQSGIYIYSTEEELISLLRRTQFPETDYDGTVLSRRFFQVVIPETVKQSKNNQHRLAK